MIEVYPAHVGRDFENHISDYIKNEGRIYVQVLERRSKGQAEFVATTLVKPSILPDILLVMSCRIISYAYSLGVSYVCA